MIPQKECNDDISKDETRTESVANCTNAIAHKLITQTNKQQSILSNKLPE